MKRFDALRSTHGTHRHPDGAGVTLRGVRGVNSVGGGDVIGDAVGATNQVAIALDEDVVVGAVEGSSLYSRLPSSGR